MRDMTREEIDKLIKEWTWGTVMVVDSDKPYGVEVAYYTDGNYIYMISSPLGRTAHSFKRNQNVAFKICDTDLKFKRWRAVIVEGKIEKVTKKEDILTAFKLLAKRMGRSDGHYEKVAEKHSNEPEKSPVHRIPIEVVGGRCNF
ncbi:MAG: hypothetical protein A2042_07645 [Candidatus Schekmanbacteria bacterium GWA2_38_11]|uniref:Pyridoxamine 5'-phosphate oxidase putative domain-containing protein n=2 Tax=Candidatus Schekmaniibacteriota TaxID=1817811 RepID=A0A1F7RMF7_9BACT|nr:MAG: hypothetical protein A2042_07645 [Candidatus Schekmanbacteria bacterium GWA2_38_11]